MIPLFYLVKENYRNIFKIILVDILVDTNFNTSEHLEYFLKMDCKMKL